MVSRLPERLLQLRRKHEFTQEQLGALLGVSDRQYANIEKGRSDPSATQLMILADQYDVSVDYLLGRPSNDESIPDKADVVWSVYESMLGLTGDQIQLLITLAQNLSRTESATCDDEEERAMPADAQSPSDASAKATAESQIMSSNYDVICPHCQKAVNTLPGRHPCPSCGREINLEIEITWKS